MKRQTAILLLMALHGSCVAASAQKNLALRGKATQSDLINNPWSGYSDANNAIDGNRNPEFYAGSCTATEVQTNPWWKVDLLDTYIITSVTITNRNSVHDRINGAELRIGTSESTPNPLAGKISTIPAGRSLTLRWRKGIEGRYVVVVIPGLKKLLTLCEVEVYGYPIPTENAAIEGKASQSSSWHFHFASLAIDGNRDARFGQKSCSHTGHDPIPWWRVDLLKTYKVFSVTITKTVGDHRLNGAEIRIGNSLENNGIYNPRCATFNSKLGLSQTFQCNSMEGRYVTVVIPRKEYLMLCEVQVKGSALD